MLPADKDRLVQWGPRPAVDAVLDRKLGHDRPARRNDNCPHTRRGAILINKLKFTSSQTLGQLTVPGLFVCLTVYPRMIFSSLTVRNRWAKRTGDRSAQALCPCPMKSQTLIRDCVDCGVGARGTRDPSQGPWGGPLLPLQGRGSLQWLTFCVSFIFCSGMTVLSSGEKPQTCSPENPTKHAALCRWAGCEMSGVSDPTPLGPGRSGSLHLPACRAAQQGPMTELCTMS